MAPGERANRGVDYGQAGVGGSSVFARRRVRAYGTVANSPGAAMLPGTLPKAPESEDEKSLILPITCTRHGSNLQPYDPKS
jgi:hypothetical protein